jgi:hypothetical protein
VVGKAGAMRKDFEGIDWITRGLVLVIEFVTVLKNWIVRVIGGSSWL